MVAKLDFCAVSNAIQILCVRPDKHRIMEVAAADDRATHERGDSNFTNGEDVAKEEEHRVSVCEGKDKDTSKNMALQITLVRPQDRYNVIYICLVIVGSGYLMPYNSFVTCVDYWHYKFPDYPIEFLLSFVYIFVSFFSVLLTNLLVKLVSTHVRILFGYVLSLGPLIYVAVFHLWLEVFSSDSVALVSLVMSCAISGVGCSIQQSSFYGYSGMLPHRYVQAVMVGESLSGVVVSFNRIVTKYYGHSSQTNTLIFFAVSCILLLCCSCLHQFVKRTEFSKFHTGEIRCSFHAQESELSSAANSQDLSNSNNDVPVVDSQTAADSEIVHRVIMGAVPDASLGFGTLGHDMDQLLEPCSRKKFCPDLLKGFRKRMSMIQDQKLWVHMVAIMNAYLCTLLLFPGFETEVRATGDDLELMQHKDIDTSWLPVVMVTLFNLTDLLGKIASGFINVRTTNPKLILKCSVARFIIVPLFIMCVYPEEEPFFASLSVPLALTVLLGLTNGFFGSVPMILAPQTASSSADRELVGNIMTFSYFVGLIIGATGAFVIEYMLSSAGSFRMF